MAETAITFRKLKVSDLHLLYRWLNQPFLIGTYSENRVSLKRVREEYMPFISGQEPTLAYMFTIDGTDAGYIQTYLIGSYPDYSSQLQVEDSAAGLDIFIGERSLLHRGYGPKVLRQFLKSIVFAELPATSCCVGPAASNKIAIRAYEKAGFRYVKTVPVRGEPEPEYLMTIDKSAILAGSERL